MSTKTRHRRHPRAANQDASTAATSVGVRERILDAAFNILAESGLQHLTQVQTAARAGVRQSHLTYYFPTRDDLLEAVTARAIDGIASALRRVLVDDTRSSRVQLLERLAHAVTPAAHMRMFVAMIVEADGDAAVRRVMRDGTDSMEAALAEALGGDHARERARLVLAAVWGLGLYQFLMRPGSKTDPTRAYLSWLADASTSPSRPHRERRRDGRAIRPLIPR
jgi:AcrR family transcriptional regulator